MKLQKLIIDQFNPPQEKNDLKLDVSIHLGTISCLDCITLPVDGEGDLVPMRNVSDVFVALIVEGLTMNRISLPACCM